MRRLVLVGGAPGVGKTTVLRHLPAHFERCACLDADDLWRVHPPALDEKLGAVWEQNVVAVLRGYLEAGYPLVFLGWLLADPEKARRIATALEDCCDEARVVYLTASPEALARRSAEKHARGLEPGYQRLKAEQIEGLEAAKIDTTGLDPDAVAARMREVVGDRKE